MGSPNDPYADLLAGFKTRKQDYLVRITNDEATFLRDEVANGTALRRGYLKGRGPRPTRSLLDQDNASVAADDSHHLVVWSDEPSLRAYVRDPWDGEDVRGAIARLWVHRDRASFVASLPVPPPPAADTTGLTFRTMLVLARHLGVMGRQDFHAKVRALMEVVVTNNVNGALTAISVFDSPLIEAIVESLDGGPEPMAADLSGVDHLSASLAALIVEGQTTPIGANGARTLLAGIYRLLPSDVVVKIVTAAVDRGMQRAQSALFGSATVPDSQADVLASAVWNVLQTLTLFGAYELSRSSLRNTMLSLATWMAAPAGTLPEATAADKGAPSLIQELFGDRWVPAGFVWPDYDQEGVYWWRSVIKHHCTEQCYQLNETADFHSTDLLRLLYLYPDPDERIPHYARTAAELALLVFKYSWNEPPATNPADNTNKAEMTTWSENHQILFAQSQLLAGALLRGRVFGRGADVAAGSGRTGQDHVTEAIPRVERWLDHRLRFGFSEWNAPGYYNEDFPPIFNLVDFCDTAASTARDDQERSALGRLRVKAAMTLDVLVFDCARYTCRGSFGVTAGRAYWEHKAYGWEQSIGNTIEILFGTRGDHTDIEPAAVALATSTYDVPEALLGIGLDRVLLDRTHPWLDRSRVSISFEEAAGFSIGFESEEDVLFWWGNEAYFDHTLEATKRIVQAHDNLPLSDPFKLLYAISDGWGKEFVVDLASACVDAVQVAGGVAMVAVLPFPLNLVVVGLDGGNIIDGVVGFFKDVWGAIKSLGEAILHWKPIKDLFGGGGDNKPDIPDSVAQGILEKMLVAFNQGTVLTKANIVTYSNGDAMLSSVQNHLVGQMAFQKQAWEANLGCDACVWTTARFMSPDVGSYTAGAARFLEHLGLLSLHEAIADVAAPVGMQIAGHGDPFGHDGPNYWTGSLALPMIVQHENAAIIAYSIPAQQRELSGASTHAWFPRAMFDTTRKQDANGGTWFFGEKQTFDRLTGPRLGSGYVALFTSRQADWTNEPGNNWNDKEIMTKGGSNIWISMVGNEQQFGSFDTFCKEVAAAYVNISGVGSLNQLECSFDMPRATAPAGRSPRLELFYDDRKGRFAGDDIDLDNFPRFENGYVQQTVARGPQGSGLRPQVEGFTAQNSVGFGSTGYSISHPATGLQLEHDITTPRRTHTSQIDPLQAAKSGSQRLQDGSLSAFRRSPRPPATPRPLAHPRLDVSGIRRRHP